MASIANITKVNLCRSSGQAVAYLADGNTVSVLVHNKTGEENIIKCAKIGLLEDMLDGDVDTPIQLQDTLSSGADWETIYTVE